jgi:cyanophycinase
MGKKDSILIAIGGGEISESPEIVDAFLNPLNRSNKTRITVMTVATGNPKEAGAKYTALFKSNGIKNIDVVDVSERQDSFNEESLEKIERSDALFFTGGDQLNITSLLGGSPLHELIRERVNGGFVIAGTSAGAMMMSNSMIISGSSDNSPMVGAVEIAPGMDFIPETLIDTHFSQRGRHGRLLTAISHYPQDIGIGLDEQTGIVVQGRNFRVVGKGVVTVMDGSKMNHNDLPYRRREEPVGMFGVHVHVLPAGYSFDMDAREPKAPVLTKMAGVENEEV